MKVVSLFAGIGGFDLALIRQGHEIVYANEWDKYAAQIYGKNFKYNRGFLSRQGKRIQRDSTDTSGGQVWVEGQVDTRSICDVPASDIPDHDLLVGGFPCQAFSIAGKRRGFDDTRGTLFFDVARILKDKRPRYLLLENVKGLLSHDEGRTFKIIISTLDELGYDIQWQVLNSKDFGVPQNRERVFIVGNLRGTPRSKIFPIREISEFYNSENFGKQGEEQGVCSTIDARYGALRNSGETYILPTIRATEYKHGDNQTLIGTYRTHKDEQGFREMKSGLAPTIPARAREDGSGQAIVAIPVLTPDRLNKRQNGRRFKEDGNPSFTLTAQDKHGIYNGISIRRLTPIECERLQGFPDGWTEGVSDTQRYKQLGNAVTVNVVYEIIRRLHG